MAIAILLHALEPLLPLLLLFFSILIPGCAQTHSASDVLPAGTPTVRVLIVEDQSQLLFSAAQPPTVWTTSSPSPRLLRTSAGASYLVTLSSGGWSIGNISLGTGQLTIRPGSLASLTLNGTLRHRGVYRLVPASDHTFDVVNDVDVESYLCGVITRETPAKAGAAAQRAQAIAARTYALYEARSTASSQQWDLYPDVRSQVYGGIASETPQAIAAVNATTGIVAAYGPSGEERIFKTYFSSCCGGVTQSVSDVFPDRQIPPLLGRTNAGLCSISSRYTWKTDPIPKSELSKRMRAWAAARNQPLRNMAHLDRIDIQNLSPFGRPIRFLIADSHGNRFSVPAEDLRNAVNYGALPKTLYSSFISISNTPAAIQFQGHGSGHGVGLCQWCAMAMAQQGYSHEAILFYSYPHCKLIRAY